MRFHCRALAICRCPLESPELISLDNPRLPSQYGADGGRTFQASLSPIPFGLGLLDKGPRNAAPPPFGLGRAGPPAATAERPGPRRCRSRNPGATGNPGRGAEGRGAVAGITGDEGADAGPVPAALVAVTVKVYVTPFVSPVTVHSSGPALQVHLLPPGEAIAV
jgi:hypothetical protein